MTRKTNGRRRHEEEIKDVHSSCTSAKDFPDCEYGLVTVLMPYTRWVICVRPYP
jgi:hypothetical protein